MPSRRVRLTFPQELITEPVIYTMAKRFDIMPNIRRAKVTETVGEVVLELVGEEQSLDKGVAYLVERGVKVEDLPGDIVE
ncbi:MAG: NIL domain-containing protein [Nitrospirae bacterium]|nr:NIL domain-containing protein [Nitrospirota bacterium]